MAKLFPLQQLPGSVETLLRAGMTGLKKPGTALPEKGYTVSGVGVDPKQFDAFCTMFGFSKSFVPSTYWHIRLFGLRALLASHPDAPFPLPGMVHLSDQIIQYSPISPEDTLEVTCKFGRLLAHDKGTAFETLTTLHREGEKVWEENAANLYLGKKKLASEPVESIQIEVETPAEQLTWDLDDTMGFKYARVSGDYNPIHLHAVGAKIMGFPKHLIHGWFTLNKTLSTEQEWLGRPHELYVSFKKPFFLPGSANSRLAWTDNVLNFETLNAKEGYPHIKGYLKPL